MKRECKLQLTLTNANWGQTERRRMIILEEIQVVLCSSVTSTSIRGEETEQNDFWEVSLLSCSSSVLSLRRPVSVYL